MKYLFILLLSFISLSLASAAETTDEFFLTPDMKVGPATGKWCTLKIESEAGGAKVSSLLFKQIDVASSRETPTIIGGVQAGRYYKFLLLGDQLTVEVRDADGFVVCTLTGNHKRLLLEGTWVTPSQNEAEFCNPSPQAAATGNQRIVGATLKINCNDR